MDVSIILIISIVLQLTAAFLALRLIWVTEKRAAWVVIAVAIALMALRRGITLYQALSYGLPSPLDETAELIGLAISILMVLGVAGIAPVFLAIKSREEALRLNDARLEALWNLSQMTAASLQEISDFALEEGVRLTKSKIGFVGFMYEDEMVLTIQSWSKTVMDQCAVIDKPIAYPLETAGLWGEAVRQRRPSITNNYAAPNPYKKGYPEGHVNLHRLLTIPVFDGERIVAVASVANKEGAYDETDVRQLGLLMDGMWRLIQDKRAEEALTFEVDRGLRIQDKLIQTCMDGIIANNFEGSILIFNENAAKILGYKPEEVIGKINVRDLYPPGLAHEIKQKIYDPALGGVGILENYETLACHKDGTLIPIWLSARLLHEGGREVGIIGHFRDLRERKKMEEELLRNERLASLGKMVAHITHEIKNPLAVIGGFSQQLKRLTELPKESRRKLQLIHEEVQRLEKFLGELGSFTRISQTQKTPGDLVALIREVGELMESGFKEKGVVFQLLDPLPLPAFPFDPGQMRQVLFNIFKNALEAMPQGGQLTVAVELQEDQLQITVTDTGHGISPDHMQNLFIPFFSTKEGGTGLGLTICRGLIDQHGGEIKIDSEVGRGTTCTIRLPLSSP